MFYFKLFNVVYKKKNELFQVIGYYIECLFNINGNLWYFNEKKYKYIIYVLSNYF